MSEKKKESPVANIIINIVIPLLILNTKIGKEMLGPVYGLIVALSFPLGYGIYDFARAKNVNFISLLGVVSVSLTGIFALMQLPPQWIAVKEAAVPFAIGVVVVLSATSKKPLVKTLLFNDQVMKLDLIDEKLEEHNKREDFNHLMKKSSYLVSLSFLVSTILNYALAKILLVSPPGTIEYNAEIARMNALSMVVIALPSTAILVVVMFYVFKQIKKMIGLDMESLMRV